ncbi:MAG: hypothetical protein JWP32_2964 [Schumannella sp.]|nr:hypothetical protein [Schumannella sp.]
MPTILPLDDDNNPIPAIRLKSDGGAHAIAAAESSARNSTAFADDTKVVSLYATGPVYVRFGTSGVNASSLDHYFPPGVYYDFSLGGDKVPHYTHIAVLRVSGDCMVYVSEKE